MISQEVLTRTTDLRTSGVYTFVYNDADWGLTAITGMVTKLGYEDNYLTEVSVEEQNGSVVLQGLNEDSLVAAIVISPPQ